MSTCRGCATRLVLVLMAAVALSARSAVNADGKGTQEGRQQAGTLMGETPRHLLVYKERSMGGVTEAEVRQLVESAGGTLLAWHPAIGTAVAASQHTGFSPDAVAKDARLLSVGPTAGSGIAQPAQRPSNERVDVSSSEQRLVQDSDTPRRSLLHEVHPRSAATTWGDSLSGLQWDMEQINVPKAHELTRGRRSIIIGILDTGVDATHPDLAPNIDYSRSASCIGGVLDRNPAAWDDNNGHGTWCAGAAAAAHNGRGIVGVAPHAKIAAIKVGTPEGLYFPEATVCAFMHAADSGVHVTSNSYYTDPWLFNCKNDPQQNAIAIAVTRAVKYALHKRVDVIVAGGSPNQNLDDPQFDSTSPDNGTAADVIPNRPVDLNCPQLPLEVSGTIGVGSVGVNAVKASSSNYGSLFLQVVAPGGDPGQFNSITPTGGVLGAYPAKFFGQPNPALPNNTFVQEDGAYYAYVKSTSIAAPHVAGIAALIRSAYPNDEQSQPRAAQVASRIMNTARPLPCPAEPVNGVTCITEPDGTTNFYGHGLVDALAALKAGPQAYGFKCATKHWPMKRRPMPKGTPQTAGGMPWQVRDQAEAHQVAACNLRKQVRAAEGHRAKG